MTEEWRPVPSMRDYEVSDLGRVRRATPARGTFVGKILSASPAVDGYLTIGTAFGPRRVHALVAEAFLGPIPLGGEVHHKNEDRADARATNLVVQPSRLAHGEAHRRKHLDRRRHGEDNPLILCSCGCKSSLPKYDRSGRRRHFVNGHNVEHDERGQWRVREGVIGSRG